MHLIAFAQRFSSLEFHIEVFLQYRMSIITDLASVLSLESLHIIYHLKYSFIIIIIKA